MEKLLSKLLVAGLIDNINGDDDRLNKMERAASHIAKSLSENPVQLISAVLAALDPDVPLDDPLIILAEMKLEEQWPTMRSVYPNKPVALLRALLLEACNSVSQVDSINNAAIILLTSVDTFPLLKIGPEEGVIRAMIQSLTEKVELSISNEIATTASKRQLTFKTPEIQDFTPIASFKINRTNLLKEIASASGPSYPSVELTQANPNWPHGSNGPWSHFFSDRITGTLSDYFDHYNDLLCKQINSSSAHVKESQTLFLKGITDFTNSQRTWVSHTIKDIELKQKNEQVKLNTLWWYEALYSSSLYCSYREISPQLACAVMAFDLLDEIVHPTPISVSYVLAEAVSRLPGAGYNIQYQLVDLLKEIHQGRKMLSASWINKLDRPPSKHMSLRDLVITVLINENVDFMAIIKDAVLHNHDVSFSLPVFSKAIFRQEQAVKIARGRL